jgi:hypothetical protein
MSICNGSGKGPATIIDRHEVLSLLAGDHCDPDANIVCPHCGGHYTHIRRVGTLKGSDPYEARTAYAGTRQTGTTPERRSALEIVFACEQCPELFALVIQQHKGINLLQIHTSVPDLSTHQQEENKR